MVDLVIGGTGFVGRNLVRRLEDCGREVVILDRNKDANVKFRGRLVIADAQNTSLLVDILNDIRPETVYHLAANSDIASGVVDASLDFGDTLMTTFALVSALGQVPVGRLVFASSSAVFGHSTQLLREENQDLPAPVSWYGKAKLVSEVLIDSLASRQRGLAVLILRFPNVVGPLATHGVVFDFVRKLKADTTTLEVLGDGNQTKPYVYVTDLLDGIDFFLQRARPGVTYVNLGPQDLASVREIVEVVCEVLGVNPKVIYQDSPFGWPGDVPRYAFDTSKMLSSGFIISTPSRNAVRRAAEDLAKELSKS